MDIQEKIELTRENIWQAIRDYGAHSYQTNVLDDVSDDFVDRLAEDSVKAKQGLREMFRKSPAWNEELDALVINGTRTHEPDYGRVHCLAREILYQPLCLADSERAELIEQAIRFFSRPEDDEKTRQIYVNAINQLAPKAYAPGKKLSRVFKAICNELGVVDNAAGSEFQKLYAQFADELSSRKIDFKLFVSLNPAHFVTMSNPKQDKRGDTLTSCHSFNSTQYDYNNGCSGYARDSVTMIAFTAADPSNPETLNNRKTTRQLFMYCPGNGLLLQSRMYNTSGGTSGAQAESKVYRDLVQREISECEGAPNLWRTRSYSGNEFGVTIDSGYGFGGYADWTYKEFAAMVSIRNDHADDYKGFEVGTYGLCIMCGCEIDEKLYCGDCGGEDDDREYCEDCGGEDDDREYCEDCEEYCDETYIVYDHGNERCVCESCRNENYYYCEECGEYYDHDSVVSISECGDYVCEDCRDRYYSVCDECDEWYRSSDMHTVVNASGYEVRVCDDCRDNHYEECDDCGEYVHEDAMYEAFNSDGDSIRICEGCRDDHYRDCDECGRSFHVDTLEDGLCPECHEKMAEDEKEVEAA